MVRTPYFVNRKLRSRILPNILWNILFTRRVVGKARRAISPDQEYYRIYWAIFARGRPHSIVCHNLFSTACKTEIVGASSSLATERWCHGMVHIQVLCKKWPKDARGWTPALRSDMEQCTLCSRSIRRVFPKGSGGCCCWSNQTKSRSDRYQSEVSYQCCYQCRKIEPDAAGISTLAVVNYSSKYQSFIMHVYKNKFINCRSFGMDYA